MSKVPSLPQAEVELPDGEFFSVNQVAELVGVHPKSVYRWIHGGQLPAVRLGRRSVRVTREALAAFFGDYDMGKYLSPVPRMPPLSRKAVA
ncbi:MAG: helix-turn-helix domain-containing protein [Mobiluncus sp.]|uniref:helix-turn-helix domain-containing protein n=1 Tax=Mobiluncus sp. TaxID=47293 RepID=UPI0025910C56|nr:helix-turn-helix domain-containing protein [Mobiluncus sp.]MCI6584052.1 helix-turn-helix domain-containing protein [Mobiluncus sp.]